MRQREGKRSEWLKEENEEIILLKIAQTDEIGFNKLEEETELSVGALNSHLNRLRKEDKIVKTISNKTGKPVYMIQNETTITKLILPDMKSFISVGLLKWILEAKINNEKEIKIPDIDLIVNTIFRINIDDKLIRQKFTPQQILDALKNDKYYEFWSGWDTKGVF